MRPVTEAGTDRNPAALARLLRLASYKAMQARLDRQRREQIARQRLLALRSDARFGWLAL